MKYKDLALILTWPDATIRGDEAWMMFFKKIGIVKNLNFKVGHTGIVLIDHSSGKMLFYDFGRYITPRGYGRARSVHSDPLLEIKLDAVIVDGEIMNLEEIVSHFESMKGVMYGEGKVYFSVVKGIELSVAKQYGDACVIQGTYPYGAVARNNNNCSRFITRMLIKSSQKLTFWHKINFPETIKASPVSNLVNSAEGKMIYSYTPDEGLKKFRMSRWESFRFLIRQLSDNVSRSRALLLPDDSQPGAMTYRKQPGNIPTGSLYLGGVGDGAWFSVNLEKKNLISIRRYTAEGIHEYSVLGTFPGDINVNLHWEITYDSHLMFTHLQQNGKKYRIEHLLSEKNIPDSPKGNFSLLLSQESN